VEAIEAGVDLLLYAQDPEMAQAAYDGLKKAVQSGRISQDRIMQSVDRVFRMRRQLQNHEWIPDEEAEEILEARHEQAFFESAMNGLVLEGNAGVLAEIPENRGLKVIVLPRRLDEHRPLPLGVVKEQLEPVGFRVVEVDAQPTDEEIGYAEHAVAEASVVVVGVASRGKMAEASKRLVTTVTRRDVIKVGVALLDPADADQMMTANCRIKTFGFAPPQLWAMCQRLLG
jgi:beta-N-acetylhexosaminidase